MALTQAVVGRGFRFATSPDGTSWTDCLEVLAFKSPMVKRNYIVIKRLDAPTDFVERIAGLRDGETYTVKCDYLPSEYARVFALDDGTPKYLRGTSNHAVPQTFTHAGFVTDVAYEVSASDEVVTLSFTITVTGPVTLA
jgi:hypothetical protein